MRSTLLIIFSFIAVSVVQAQKTDSVVKNPGNILEMKYNKSIQAADEYFKNKDFANAKTYYQNALQLKPNEQYPKDKIVEIDKWCVSDKQEKYKALILKADSLCNAKEYALAYETYQQASAIKPNEQYPKDVMQLCKKKIYDIGQEKEQMKKDSLAWMIDNNAKQDSTKKDIFTIVAIKFSFIGTWRGKIDNDYTTLMFNSDGSFRGIIYDPKPDDVVGIWKLTGDSLYVEADEPEEIAKPNYKNNPEKIYLKYKVKNNNEVELYFSDLKKWYVFKRTQ